MIEALPTSTVHLIKSSQVITSLVSIVKELVENAIDAGATILTVRLENFGFDRIEVRDNGSGINEKNAAFVALPHHTSKIKNFSDLENLSSYGFRGEALASLCAVSDVTITSKVTAENIGHVFSYNQNGVLTNTKPISATKGNI